MYGDGDLYGQAIGLFDWGFAQPVTAYLPITSAGGGHANVLEILAVAAAGAGGVGASREQNEARSPVGTVVAYDDQRLRTHGVPRGQAVGEQPKRVHRIQLLSHIAIARYC